MMIVVLALAILAVAAFYRLAGLELKPVHHDECVNYVFTKKLLDTGNYQYNPTAYHGPLLYYLALPAPKIAGFSKTTIRFMPALFGVLTVLLVLLLGREVGAPGALFAAAVLALSPANVYFDKTFLHEVYFSFATVGLIWMFLEAIRSGKATAVIWCYLFAVLGFAVKETAAFNVAAILAAWAIYWLTARRTGEAASLHFGALLGRPDRQPLLWALGMGVSLWLLLFSNFLRNPHGLLDFFAAYFPWFQTGVQKPTHVKAWHYFFVLLYKYYWPVLPFVAWAALRAFWKSKPRSLAILAVAVVIQGVYSVIPYKTPWCVLSIGIVWMLVAADGFSDLWTALRYNALRVLLAVLTVAGLAYYGQFSYILNFREYDYNHNDSNEARRHDVVYVQTQREYEQLPADLRKIAAVSGAGDRLPIFISGGSKNPGRFYLRDFRKVKVEGAKPPQTVKQDVILVRENERKKYEERYDGPYHRYQVYPVFPGWKVDLMIREELWQKLEAAGLTSPPIPPS